MASIRLTYRRRPAPARHPSRASHAAAPAASGRFARRLAGAVLLSALLPLPALADTDADAAPAAQRAARRAFDIPAGSLEGALNRFGRDAGILLAFPAELTSGLTSGGVHGRFDVDGALDRLLAGTGLVALRQPGGGYTLMRANGSAVQPAAAGAAAAAELPAINVRSTALRAESYRPAKEANVLRSDIPLLDTAQAVNVVPAQVLRDQRPRNLDDALGNVSGITQGNTLAGTQDTIMKRGFGGNRDGSIMHNGMPIVQGRSFNAAVDSVEVLKGPTSLLYGLMDPGGVVNVVSKQPQLTRYNAISLGASTFGHGKNGGSATFDSTGPIGDSRLAYRLIVDQSNEQYWRNFGENRQTFVAPSLAWYGRDTQVVVSYEYRKFHSPFDRGTALDPRTNAPLDIPARRRLDEPFNNMDGESHLAQLSIDHQFNADWSAHLGYSYNRETYDANQLRTTGVDPVKGTLSRSNDATHGSLSTDSYGIAYVNAKLTLAGMRHDLQLGVDSEYRRIYRKDMLRQAVKTPFSYIDPVYGLLPPSSTVSASDSDQTDTLHDTSVFLQDSIHLTDKWIVSGGLRYITYNQVAGRGRPFTANTDLSGSKWLPRAGVVYKWTDSFSLYGSYSQSLKPSSSIAPMASGYMIDGSTPPEEATAWEVGGKLDLPGGMTGTLALFNIDKKNVLVSQYNDTTKLTDWRTSGKARSRGVELDVSGRIGERVNVIASYAYIDAKTVDDPLYAGNRLWNVARHTASLAAVYDVGTLVGGDDLRIGAAARYVGARPGDSANSFTLPSYVLADAFATYDTRIGKQKLSFQLNVKNLFNRTYYPSSANRYFVAIGDARQVSLLTTLQF
ncbi:Ferric hydroxamate uptake,ferrichrome outer membrane transporter,Outer membrane receptor for monomeric catechols,TonB-dependent siderophore receptor,TonB dependent receptor [Burkholderia stabilis]|uniref:Ferric hydroxamate uptake,ferrichrome outer membrane transporter,Outer membrane receptor for monomeric catechols,TonB-dependent siderophore receptor,TonB dependent receptor n=2 Tax=Burkholderia stabilis TaxID=95485 RepID=A0AAJ5T325_9BURK|nr:Ferric hydroxamate uptake,ferrichrome outer membrane transporter,Outer membrane receptor for monomeric catechols,TonB-dependent siderophore receptor,TonB dependent receptor [Burkholderia stabilis]